MFHQHVDHHDDFNTGPQTGDSLQEQDMLVVHLPDGLFDPVVVLYQSGVFGVGGFVEGVVPGYPGVGFVVLREGHWDGMATDARREWAIGIEIAMGISKI
jgi:hypothetical protein